MQDRQVIEWDKDDIDIRKFMKVISWAWACWAACAPPSTCWRNTMECGTTSPALRATINPPYAMIQQADTLGTP